MKILYLKEKTFIQTLILKILGKLILNAQKMYGRH